MKTAIAITLVIFIAAGCGTVQQSQRTGAPKRTVPDGFACGVTDDSCTHESAGSKVERYVPGPFWPWR
jgi:hypothetical protein